MSSNRWNEAIFVDGEFNTPSGGGVERRWLTLRSVHYPGPTPVRPDPYGALPAVD